MKYCIRLKFDQSLEFRERLAEVQNKVLFYKQSNFKKIEAIF